MSEILKAPFPWFGGKSRAAQLVWERLGDVKNYVEPFFGSGAILLGRPTPPGIETVNDRDGFICNAWRAIAYAPEETASYADWPVNENDLHARHIWLLDKRDTLTAKLEGDPDYFDAKIAGWWMWGMACWIGSGFCSGNGSWTSIDGLMTRGAGRGVSRQLVHLGTAGQGVKRQRVHLDDYFQQLSARLRRARVCCGDWRRVLGPTPTTLLGLTGIVLDPPYSMNERVYSIDSVGISDHVREWAIEHGDDPLMRIVLCGYDTEHTMPDSWSKVAWKANGGYACQGIGKGQENAHRETLWFSPHCLIPDNEYRQYELF